MEALFPNTIPTFQIPSSLASPSGIWDIGTTKFATFRVPRGRNEHKVKLHFLFQRSCCVTASKSNSFNDTWASGIENDDASLEKDESGEGDASGSMNWEAEFLGEIDPFAYLPPKKRKKQQGSRLLRDTDEMDWCVRARKIALKSIEARGLTPAVEKLADGSINKKKKKAKNKSNFEKIKVRPLDEDLEFDIGDDDLNSDSVDAVSYLRESVKMIDGGALEQKKVETREAFVQRLSQFSGPSDRSKEVNLNKAIVEAQTAEEVLEITADTITAVAKGLSPSPLSPLNIATALHRIAKNMEKVSMTRTHRLTFARRREMCMLVGIAMTALPECSAQGISNIAWAVSKIGGELLYLTEMDRVAEVSLIKVGELNSQNVANIAGAFASMQHSAPELFLGLSKRAAEVVDSFQPQEIAQVLWAFASLSEPADLLLDSLDRAFSDFSQFKSTLEKETLSYSLGDVEGEDASCPPVLKLSRDQLGNISWSYAVFGQMDRVFFLNVWKNLCQLLEQKISEQYREDIMFASQVHLVNQCLKLESQHHQLALKSDLEDKIARARRTSKYNKQVTSSFQKEVARLLVCTGLDWVREYVVDGYTLDAVLIDKKVALEIDGPSHFSRNSGVPLGHTCLKRRYIAAIGWNLVSVPHQEWEELRGEFEQMEYLRTLLNDHIYQGSTPLQDSSTNNGLTY